MGAHPLHHTHTQSKALRGGVSTPYTTHTHKAKRCATEKEENFADVAGKASAEDWLLAAAVTLESPMVGSTRHKEQWLLLLLLLFRHVSRKTLARGVDAVLRRLDEGPARRLPPWEWLWE